jgi:hypothetical protein
MNTNSGLSRFVVVSLLVAAIASVGLVAAGCTGAGISRGKAKELHKQVQTHGLIIGFEGLQPFSGHHADDLTRRVAKDLGLAHAATSGNPEAHMPFIIEANANHQPIYIVGYSLGGNEAKSIAWRCKRAGIPIAGLFLLDPGAMGLFNGKIPDNVRKVVFYCSGSYSSSVTEKPPGEVLEDPTRTRLEFEDLERLNHLNLPANVTRRIKAQIAEDSGRR